MSRTIRRKNAEPYTALTHDYVRVLEGDWCPNSWRWMPLPEKEQKRNLAKFYSDCGHSTKYHCTTRGRKEWLLTFQNTERRSARDQLRKFMLDEEYEVMVSPNRPFLDYWD